MKVPVTMQRATAESLLGSPTPVQSCVSVSACVVNTDNAAITYLLKRSSALDEDDISMRMYTVSCTMGTYMLIMHSQLHMAAQLLRAVSTSVQSQ